MISPGSRILTSSGSLILWGACAVSGTFLLGAYHARPGDAANPPVRWPTAGRMTRDPIRPSLVIFLHPLCPCSRASVSELSHIVASAQGRLAVHAVVLTLPSPAPAWEDSGMERDLSAIPGVNVHLDPDGEEARRFGVVTSGNVLVFDSTGNRVFSGGITSSRGQEGESDGRAAVLAWISGGTNGPPSCPVFGCPLVTPKPPGDGGNIR